MAWQILGDGALALAAGDGVGPRPCPPGGRGRPALHRDRVVWLRIGFYHLAAPPRADDRAAQGRRPAPGPHAGAVPGAMPGVPPPGPERPGRRPVRSGVLLRQPAQPRRPKRGAARRRVFDAVSRQRQPVVWRRQSHGRVWRLVHGQSRARPPRLPDAQGTGTAVLRRVAVRDRSRDRPHLAAVAARKGRAALAARGPGRRLRRPHGGCGAPGAATVLLAD